MKTWIKKILLYPLEFLAICIFFGFCKILGPQLSSKIGGALFAHIGPIFPVTKVAYKNLKIAFPRKSNIQYKRIIKGMWRNLGAVIFEYPHLNKLLHWIHQGKIQIEGGEILEALKKQKKPALFFTAHLANWEIISLVNLHYDLGVRAVYRKANNPYVNWILHKIRKLPKQLLIAKGPAGAREILRQLNSGHCVCMLVDQKMNDGQPVLFFGKPAMTATAISSIATKTGIDIIPIHVERLYHQTAKFNVIIEKPWSVRKGSDPQKLMLEINQHMESWIKKHPDQWLWVHNRWSA